MIQAPAHLHMLFCARALFFKEETSNNLVPKCFLRGTKTCSSGFFSLLRILAFDLHENFFFNLLLNSLFPLLPLRGDVFKETEYLICFWEENIISHESRLLLSHLFMYK